MRDIAWFKAEDITDFPDPRSAQTDPDGLLAAGGNLSVKTLVSAYEAGIFPWFSEQQPILWWSPATRAIIATKTVHTSKNMQKLMRQKKHTITFDKAFRAVIHACSRPCQSPSETWITPAMKAAYWALFRAGHAHSVEVWNGDGKLVGGLYGVFVKNTFCGESMFRLENNTSKLALIGLARLLDNFGCPIIDCQLPTKHLASLGAKTVSRDCFLNGHKESEVNPFLEKQSWEQRWPSC